MKVIATIQVDFERSGIGTRSRMADDMAGVPVLRRTVDRVLACERVDAVFVLCPTSDVGACTKLVESTEALVVGTAAHEAPWTGLVRRARKWALDGWRGGLGGATFFDEFVDCRVLAGLLQDVNADLVLSVPPAAPLFDPALADRMIDHKWKMEQDFRLVFCQTPPGLSGLVLEPTLIQELAASSSPVGWAFTYQPDAPRRDLIFEACCLEVPHEVRHAVGRLSVDCDRGAALVVDCLQANCDKDATTIGRWLIDRRSWHVESLPREVEVELTTDDPYPDGVLRPREPLVDARGPIDRAVFESVLCTICRNDDALLVLGGFGDPLRHPSLADLLRAIRAERESGFPLFGLAVRTSGADLTPDIVRAMIEYEVDVLDVTLDAWSGDLYAKLQDPNARANASLEKVLANLEMVATMRAECGSVHPVLVPEFTKSRENVHELDEFHDGWIRRFGTVMIGAASTFAGQFDDHRVIDMAPAARKACRRLSSRCVVLANGRVIPCDQDFNGKLAMGQLGERDLGDIWNDAGYGTLRRAHESGCTGKLALCGECSEWQRP